MRTANPALSDRIFIEEAQRNPAVDSNLMTIQGTVNKSIFLLSLLVMSAGFVAITLLQTSSAGADGVLVVNSPLTYPLMLAGSIGSLIVVIVAMFKKSLSPVLAPVYALLEGLFIGAISIIMETVYPGIVLQASMITFGTLFGLLGAYKSGLIRATENFKLGVAAATMGIFLAYIANFVMGFFGASIPMIHEGGLFGIVFSLFVVVIASLNLVLDFDFIENGEKQGAPKYMEWYASLGLMVTLVWLYIEVLRLLSKLRD